MVCQVIHHARCMFTSVRVYSRSMIILYHHASISDMLTGLPRKAARGVTQ